LEWATVKSGPVFVQASRRMPHLAARPACYGEGAAQRGAHQRDWTHPLRDGLATDGDATVAGRDGPGRSTRNRSRSPARGVCRLPTLPRRPSLPLPRQESCLSFSSHTAELRVDGGNAEFRCARHMTLDGWHRVVSVSEGREALCASAVL
jgi:hypothetical protein